MIFGKDEFKKYRKAADPLYLSPQSIQQTLEIRKIAENGIFEVAKRRYSKCYRYDDINYESETEEQQLNILLSWCNFLNTLEYETKIITVNKPRDIVTLRKEMLYQMQGDAYDIYRKATNLHIEKKLKEGRKGVDQDIYLTVTVPAKDYDEAKELFLSVESSMEKSFLELKSHIHAMDAAERLMSVRACYRMDGDNQTPIRFQDYVTGKDFKSDVVNCQETVYEDTFFHLDQMYCRVLYVAEYPNDLSDQFYHSLTSLPVYSITSQDIIPIPADVGIRRVQNILMGIEDKIHKQQQTRNKNNDFSSDISYKVRKEKQDIENELTNLTSNDQREFYAGLTMTVMAHSREELETATRTVQTLAKKAGCRMETVWKRQREGFNTCLPIGVRQTNLMRSMQTRSLSALQPFHVQEMFYRSPNYFYGINQLSKNMILGNRKKLIAGHGFILGETGSGKSFKGKEEMTDVILTVDDTGKRDDIIVIDPQNEYEDFAKMLGGTFINLSNQADRYVNPLDVDLEELYVDDRNGVIADKCDLMLCICSQCIGSQNMGLGYESIIDRCCKQMYERIAGLPVLQREQPILEDFTAVLKEQEENAAQEIALAMEAYTTGTMNLFNHPTTLDADNRMLVYGIKDLGEKIRPLAMLVMLETIKRKIYANAKKGVTTWLYIDEIHVLMRDPYIVGYLYNFWKTLRKFKCIITGLTQNISDLTKNDTSTAMLSNSEFIVLMKQSKDDIYNIIDHVEGFSPAQAKYVAHAASGTGIIKHGNIIIPFDSRMDKESVLYWVYTTDPHEKEEKERRLEELRRAIGYGG